MRLATLFAAFAAVLFLAGCPSVPKEYAAADQATYDAIAPEYTAYVQADPKLTQEQKDRRLRTLQTWKVRINAGK